MQGVKFTMVSDCCHSGSMLDHPQQQISGNKDPNAPPGVTAMNPMDMLGMFFKDMPVRACSTIIHCTGLLVCAWFRTLFVLVAPDTR